jgi:HEAT repeat protein
MLKRLCIFAALLSLSLCAAGAEISDEEIGQLIKQLGNDKYALREEASIHLRLIGKRAIPALKAALKHKDLEISERATRLLDLVMWGLPANIQKKLGNFAKIFAGYPQAAPARRIELLVEFRSLAPGDALHYILQAAESFAGTNSQPTLIALLDIYRDKETESLALKSVASSNSLVRKNAATVLARSESVIALKTLILMLDDKDTVVVGTALNAIAHKGYLARKSAEVVRKLLKHLDHRLEAIRTLAAIGDAGSIKLISALAKADQDINVRMMAIAGLSKLAPLNDAFVSGVLIDLLKDPQAKVVTAAIKALSDMAALRAAPALLAILKKPDQLKSKTVGQVAAQALVFLSSPDQKKDLNEVMNLSSDSYTKCLNLIALARLGQSDSLLKLTGLLKNRDRKTSFAAAKALAASGQERWSLQIQEIFSGRRSHQVIDITGRLLAVDFREPKYIAKYAKAISRRRGFDLMVQLDCQHFGLFEQALAALLMQTKGKLDQPEWLGYIASLMVSAGRESSGIKLLSAAQEMDPFDSNLNNNLSWYLLVANDASVRDYPRALVLAERASLLAPRTAYILDTYAWALSRNGRQARALQVTEKALKLLRSDEPGEEATLLVHKARMLIALKRNPEALKELQSALKRFPRLPDVAVGAAEAYCEAGMPQEALKQLDRLLELSSPDLRMLQKSPELEPVRKLPEFAAHLERARAKYQELKKLFKTQELPDDFENKILDAVMKPGKKTE